MARIVMPVYEGVDTLDVCGPIEMMNWTQGKLRVDLLAERPGEVTFNSGLKFLVPDGLHDVQPCDALWVPGGDPDALKRIFAEPDRTYLDFLRMQAAVSRYVCSVCEGALLLARAGLLDGYTVTTHWRFIPYLVDHHPAVRVADGHPRFVLDRNRLTGGGISAGLDESLKLIELLTDTATAEAVQLTTQYFPDPPVHTEIPKVTSSPM
jgi:transcriptional regulator GlxA family with amidase domain